ncbi:MAG: TOBE domain-containing protein, partial [Bradyrhizobium sp.]
LIAVMNGGKIDQLGTPEDIYDRPQSEFVARFIGASNVLKGVARDESHIAFSGVTLRVVGAKLAANQDAAVAIRQHDIQLSTGVPQGTENTVKATVTRQVFLGANRDYVLETADGTNLRAVTSPEIAIPAGTEVWVTLPPERCRALSR